MDIPRQGDALHPVCGNIIILYLVDLICFNTPNHILASVALVIAFLIASCTLEPVAFLSTLGCWCEVRRIELPYEFGRSCQQQD